MKLNARNRKEAIEFGVSQYFTGRPCKHGHVAGKFTANGRCVVCSREAIRGFLKSNPGKVRDYHVNYVLRNPGKKEQSRLKWRVKNPENQRECTKRWWDANPEKRNAYVAAYRAAKIQRTPSWADMAAIEFVYEQAPKGTEVDHVIPLQGELVSGLHVHYNLQVLPKSENRRKNNRFEVA